MGQNARSSDSWFWVLVAITRRQLPELTIAKESKVNTRCARQLGMNEAIPAMFGNVGSFGSC
jgi:hypothetical protein